MQDQPQELDEQDEQLQLELTRPARVTKHLNETVHHLCKQMNIPLDQLSDGYHTFKELYDHRYRLYIQLAKMVHEKHVAQQQYQLAINPQGPHPVVPNPVWRSQFNSDGSRWEGWFLMGIHSAIGEQISYHLPMEYWEETAFATTHYNDLIPFDGHTSADVLERLKRL